MRLQSLRIERRPKIMIIPMIDIIFFLLVFFIMSTLYMVEQRTIPVNLPQAANAQLDMSHPILITVTARGQLLIDKEEMTLDLFKRRVQVELVHNREAAFLLRADQQVAYGKVVEVLDDLKSLGVKRIAVAADAKQR